jgi:hypothetical protein
MLAVSNHLNSFVGRREQLRKIQHDFSAALVGEARCSPAVDYVAFSLRDPRPDHAGSTLQVKLLYEKLDSMLPTRVVAKSIANSDDDDDDGEGNTDADPPLSGARDRLSERLLKSKPLADALAASFGKP